jgi:3-phosphoshikimate 1-carboxyvinyltransferase
MKLVLKNGIMPKGQVTLPPSKSEAVRAALLYALSGGDPARAVEGFDAPFCRDIECAIGAARALGGMLGGALGEPLCAGESAALLRMLIPISLALFGRAEIVGAGRVFERGIGELEECFGVEARIEKGRLYMEKSLDESVYEIDCSRSSQFISGLMLALPLTGRACEIVIKKGFVSRPYAYMTAELIRRFGGLIEETERGFRTHPSRYAAPEDSPVVGDESCAAVFRAMNFAGGEIEIIGSSHDPLQPDAAAEDLMKRDEADITDCPDLLPILAAAACAKRGVTIIRGTARLKTKESDRESGIVEMIRALGGEAFVGENCVVIGGAGRLAGGECSSMGDHRLAFAAAIMACICEGPVLLHGAEAVEKSAPAFWSELARLTYKGV